MMEPKFAILTNKNIQEEKSVLICWMELHHQLLFEPGRTPALVLPSGHPPLLRKDARVLIQPKCEPQAHPGEQPLPHILLLAPASLWNNCWSAQVRANLREQTFSALFPTKYFRQKN